MQKNNVIIIGAAQHARIVSNLIKSSKSTKNKFNLVGFIDDNEKLHGSKIDGKPILGSFKDVKEIFKKNHTKYFLIGISAKHIKIRSKYYNLMIEYGFKSFNAIHDSAIIDKKSTMGIGNIINPGCIVNAFSKIGNNCVMYSGSIIEHEDILCDNVFVGPGVALTANIQIGNNCYIGVGARVIPHVKIGDNVTVGAGSVVLNDVDNNLTVAGIPAKKIK